MMARNLKALGLVLVAAFAMSAVAASAASAHEFHSEIEDTFLTAKALAVQTFFVTNSSGDNVKCENVSVDTGTILGKKIAANNFATPNATVVPTYEKCKATRGATEAAATIEFTTPEKKPGCAYVFFGETTGTPAKAPVEIECEPNDEIQIKVTALKLKCIEVPAQKVEGVHYTNENEGNKRSVIIEPSVTGIKSTTPSSTACPTTSGEKEIHEGGTYTGNVTVSGDNAAKEQVGIWVE